MSTTTAFAMAPPLHRKSLAPVSVRKIHARALQQAKLGTLNKMNGPLPSTPLKRVVSCDSGENALPMKQLQPAKRKRAHDDDGQVSESPKALKASRISLVTVEKPAQPTTSKFNTPMPKPAGRSLQTKNKPTKAFGRRSQRDSLTNITDASRTKSRPAPLSSSRKVTQPASWSFNIHVDTPDEEATNTMQHFTTRLDISDDECKTKHDDRGKENIPPSELGVTMPMAALQSSYQSRKNMMAPFRSPLAELKASDYYGPGLDALSYAVIYDDENSKIATEMLNAPSVGSESAMSKALSLTAYAPDEYTMASLAADGITVA